MISLAILLTGAYLVIGIASYNDSRTPNEIAMNLVKFTGVIATFALLVWSSKFPIISKIWTVIWTILGIAVVFSVITWLSNNPAKFFKGVVKLFMISIVIAIIAVVVIIANDISVFSNGESRSNPGGDYIPVKEYFQP